MSRIIIDSEICFECGKPSGEKHHVIPKIRGGTKTIPLCVECHCKVHNLKNRPDHRILTIEGLQKAKERGVKLGNPKNLTNDARNKGVQTVKENAINNDQNRQAQSVITSCKEKGMSYRQIAEYLNQLNFKTRYGKEFFSSTVYQLYKNGLNNQK